MKTKFKKNLEAIRALHQIRDEGRTAATPAEQEAISQFVGWGQMPGLFNERWVYNAGMSYQDWQADRDKWKEERKQLKSLMTDDEWEAAKRGRPPKTKLAA